MDSPANPSNDADADELALFLHEPEAAQVKQFRSRIRSCDSDAEKYELCLGKRDQLLDEQEHLQIEFAYYEQVFTESTIYKASKTQESWRDFTATAAEGSKSRDRITNELKKAAGYWGEDLVEHYSVGERGINFAIQFAATAKSHPDWETQALPRFQQLVCRRIQLAKHGRHKFVHPLERTDLINAKMWTVDGPYVKMKDPERVSLPLGKLRQDQVPEDYGFDQHGLLVPKPSAVSCSDGSNGINKRNIGGMDSSIPRLSIEAADDTNATATGALNETPKADRVSAPDDAMTTLCSGKVDATPEEAAAEEVDGQAASRAGGDSSVLRVAHDDMPLRRSLRTQANNTDQPVVSGPTKSSSRQRGGGTKSSRRTCAQENEAAVSASAQRGLDMKQLKTLTSKLSYLSASVPTASPVVSVVPIKRQRAASLPPDIPGFHALKRHRLDCLPVDPDAGRSHDHSVRPVCDWAIDGAYLAQAILEKCREANKTSNSRGSHTARVLLPILRRCEHPDTDGRNGAIELQLLDGHQAKALLDSTTPEVPIITEGQQHFQWRNQSRPIPEFFEWIEDHDQVVSVQIPSLEADKCSYEPRSIQQVYKRFLAARETDDPWNILDFRCSLPSTLPDFLTGRNCQLLAQIRDRVLNRDSAERTVASREDWAEWRDVEHWALLSEGGHCTAPHMDSHGLATWITLQAGLFGFIWISRPTDQQRKEWMEDPEHYDERQQWRYWILKPGQTIFIPSGTIHGVFRIRQSQTLGLGGHILQWSGIAQWMDIVSGQLDFPDCTNEDMRDAWKWIPVVKDLLQKRIERVAVMN